MKVVLRNSLTAIAAVMAITLLSSCGFPIPGSYHDTGVSDDQYVSLASRTPEAGLFLAAYPQAEALVDRDGALAVDFRVGKHVVTSTSQRWEGIRLRVFIDPGSNQSDGRTLVQCDDKIVQTDTMSYLRRHLDTNSCQ